MKMKYQGSLYTLIITFLLKNLSIVNFCICNDDGKVLYYFTNDIKLG